MGITVQVGSVTLEMLNELINGCQPNEQVTFLIFIGQVEVKSGKRAYGYKIVGQGGKFEITNGSINFNEVEDVYFSETMCLAQKISGSWDIGNVLAVKTENEGETVFTKTGLCLGYYEEELDIARWQASNERLTVLRLAKTKSKEHNFDEQLKRNLQGIKNVYKRGDNITRQYIVAKIIYFLNS